MRIQLKGGRAAIFPFRTPIRRTSMMAGCATACLAIYGTAAAAQSAGPGDTTPSSVQDTSAPTAAATTASSTATLRTTKTDKGSDEIVVTGSRLPQKRVTDLPVTILSGQTISDQGYTNIGQALTQLPTFGVPATATSEARVRSERGRPSSISTIWVRSER